MYLHGQWTQGDVSDWLEVINPATEAPIGKVPRGTAEDVDQAIRSSREAWQTWRWTNAAVRADFLRRIAARLRARLDDVASAMTQEQGKPLNEARGEVAKLAKTFDYYAEEAVRVFGKIIPNDEAGYISLVEKEPIGVVAAIAPWNYPVELIGWKLGAALAAGCTIVVKPSEYTPLSAIVLYECLDEAGLPPGVANLVTGDGQTGAMLVSHPDIDKIAFTGSQATGEKIFKSMRGIKSVSMELGGSCPLVVTAKADLEQAVKGAARRSFRNMGQVCIAINRIFVQDAIYEPFLDKLATATNALRIDDGTRSPDADLGPMTYRTGRDRVEQHVADATAKGARLICGGQRPEQFPMGFFYRPTVLADCGPEMQIMSEETFGPVVGVAPFTTLNDAIRMANNTPYGLAAYAYTEDVHETFTLSRRLDFGSVAINNVDAGIINAPYGGRKQSGVGYEHGTEGMEGYLQLKHVRLRHHA